MPIHLLPNTHRPSTIPIYERDPLISRFELHGFSALPNSFRLHIEVRRITSPVVYLLFRVSRPTNSPEEFHDIYGMNQTQTGAPYPDQFYNQVIARELDKIGVLPKPFDIIYHMLRSIHQSPKESCPKQLYSSHKIYIILSL